MQIQKYKHGYYILPNGTTYLTSAVLIIFPSLFFQHIPNNIFDNGGVCYLFYLCTKV